MIFRCFWIQIWPQTPSGAAPGPQIWARRPLLATVRPRSLIFIDFWFHFGGPGNPKMMSFCIRNLTFWVLFFWCFFKCSAFLFFSDFGCPEAPFWEVFWLIFRRSGPLQNVMRNLYEKLSKTVIAVRFSMFLQNSRHAANITNNESKWHFWSCEVMPAMQKNCKLSIDIRKS